jgi:acetyl coenzyme A synthetase (ADP forming)-like protein
VCPDLTPLLTIRRAQLGVWTRAQALAVGLTHPTLRAWVTAGAITELYPDVVNHPVVDAHGDTRVLDAAYLREHLPIELDSHLEHGTLLDWGCCDARTPRPSANAADGHQAGRAIPRWRAARVNVAGFPARGTMPSHHPTPHHEHETATVTYETMHALPDGTTVRLRPIRPDDGDRLLAMWARTDESSRRARFARPSQIDASNIKAFVDLDPELQYAVVATHGRGDEERIIGVARYERASRHAEVAEFAALIEDSHQGRGIGTGLLRHVATAAKAAGVRQLTGDVLADNERMLRLLADLGLEVDSLVDGSRRIIHADLAAQLGDEFLQVVDESDRVAARAAVHRFLHPRRIAVVGASRDKRNIGGLVFDNLLHGEFTGVVYPVNREADHVQGVAAYDALGACPKVPDLVLVCVPAEQVSEVVDEAGALGIKAVCVVSAGFAETGERGAARQAEMMQVARSHGLRIIGPNCMGLLNGTADFRMNGTFSTTFPTAGRVAMSSQSGALGLAVLDHVAALGLGISSFVSIGNKADISGNDLLSFWETDDATDVVLLYLESFGNPRKFSRIARRVSRRKPIVVVKSGRTQAGERAAASHTAAVSSGDVAAAALFTQTGVIRTDTLQGMFDVATLLQSQPLPRGNRVAILTNAGGPGILAADACESNGLQVPPLSAATQASLSALLVDEASRQNPVDMIASASPSDYGAALRVLGQSEEVDAIVVIFIPTGAIDTDQVAAALGQARSAIPDDLPVLSVFMSKRGVTEELAESGIPSYAFPEDAARALGRVTQYADWRARPLGSVVRPDGLKPDKAREIVRSALAFSRTPSGSPMIGHAHGTTLSGARHRPLARSVWLSQVETDAVLRSYGVPMARSRLVSTPEQAAAVQEEIGAPVVVKIASPIHKTDVGGIELDLRSPGEAASAVERLRDRLTAQGMPEHAERFLVQELEQDGIEMVVGVSHDPSFGPLLVTGMGGTLVELLRDVAVRITPITDRDVTEMLDSLRMKPLLDGYRGGPAMDVEALTDMLHRIGALVEDVPEVVELDCNPVFVRPAGRGVVAVDVRLRVATQEVSQFAP